MIIVTGGTGGHIIPAISAGEYFKENFFNVNFITDERGLNHFNLVKLRPKVIQVKGFIGKTFLQKIISIILIIYPLLKPCIS